MMTEKQIIKAFKDTKALLEGHFELRSKLHSNRYFQCANVLMYPRVASKLCREVTKRAVASGRLGKKIDGVISANISFMTQKLTLEADEKDFDKILKAAQKAIKKIEPDCRIIL